MSRKPEPDRTPLPPPAWHKPGDLPEFLKQQRDPLDAKRLQVEEQFEMRVFWIVVGSLGFGLLLLLLHLRIIGRM
jgi:hypothetical protein